ncbi:hypothetical protein BDA99DRAFT_326887 [Phascolomyces articulosus]|uniref:Uncharacterized protein n=1 Tax=Phascolomyces articulosus TaxID=60185 RepID=A0AAD5PID2_9FUNG|nr:hypothetical protein BDA99DRAFT_326887 [Phascolomyces articulosus]
MLTMAGAFSNVQNTLTKLDFTFVKCEVPLISLSEILLFCKNLNTLIFDALDYADKFIGDHERLEEPHKELVNMEMSTISTTGEALEPLLKKCPKLRRVAMKNCDAKIPDVLYEHCPSLEIFGYEADFADVPQLDDLPQQQQQQENDGEQQPCLREIYTRDGGYGVPAEGIIRLLRKNAKTLKVVFINLYLTAQQKSNNEPHDGIHPDYGEPFKFEQLEKLTYWPDIYGAAEPLLLHAIESCPSLKMFNPAYSTNISQIVDTIKKSPTVEQLELTNVSCYDNLGSDDFMTQLFKAYADETHIPDLNLRTVRFHDSNVITDSVLDALADIKTLEVVKLFDLTRVTTEGLKAFLQKLDKNDIRIKELRLDDLYIVDDAVLRLLPNLKYLESLHLEDLVRITDNGVKYLVDNVKGLHHFKLKHCICISREDMSAYVENSKNIKHFETMHDSS